MSRGRHRPIKDHLQVGDWFFVLFVLAVSMALAWFLTYVLKVEILAPVVSAWLDR